MPVIWLIGKCDIPEDAMFPVDAHRVRRFASPGEALRAKVAGPFDDLPPERFLEALDDARRGG